ATDAEILDRLEKRWRAGHPAEPLPQSRDHLVGAEPALRGGLQRDEHTRGVHGVTAADAAPAEAHHALDGRVALDDIADLGELLLHGLERDVLRGLDRSGQPTGVLLREESLGD